MGRKSPSTKEQIPEVTGHGPKVQYARWLLQAGRHNRPSLDGKERDVFGPGDTILFLADEPPTKNPYDKKWKCLDPEMLTGGALPTKEEEQAKMVVEETAPGQFSVVNSRSRQPINMHPLTKAEAEALVGDSENAQTQQVSAPNGTTGLAAAMQGASEQAGEKAVDHGDEVPD